MMTYLIEKDYLNKDMSSCIVRTAKNQKKHWWEPKKAKEKTKAEFYPGATSTYFTYKGLKFWAFLRQQKETTTGWDNKPTIQESLYITCYGGSPEIIQQMIDEAVCYSMDQEKGLLGIFQAELWLSTWVKMTTKKARTLNSVVLD